MSRTLTFGSRTVHNPPMGLFLAGFALVLVLLVVSIPATIVGKLLGLVFGENVVTGLLGYVVAFVLIALLSVSVACIWLGVVLILFALFGLIGVFTIRWANAQPRWRSW